MFFSQNHGLFSFEIANVCFLYLFRIFLPMKCKNIKILLVNTFPYMDVYVVVHIYRYRDKYVSKIISIIFKTNSVVSEGGGGGRGGHRGG